MGLPFSDRQLADITPRPSATTKIRLICDMVQRITLEANFLEAEQGQPGKGCPCLHCLDLGNIFLRIAVVAASSRSI
jgi:hypothetical protein